MASSPINSFQEYIAQKYFSQPKSEDTSSLSSPLVDPVEIARSCLYLDAGCDSTQQAMALAEDRDRFLSGTYGSFRAFRFFSDDGDSRFDPKEVGMRWNPSSPKCFRDALKTQHTYKLAELGSGESQYPRIQNLVTALFCIPNLVWRTCRAAVRIIFAPITLSYNFAHSKRVGHRVEFLKHDLFNILYEVTDVAVVAMTFFVSLLHTVAPSTINLARIGDLYGERMMQQILWNQDEAEVENEYIKKQKEAAEQRHMAQSNARGLLLDTISSTIRHSV